MKVEKAERARAARPWEKESLPFPAKQPHFVPPSERVRSHFSELAAAAERSHRKLLRAKSPYRFCVHREGEEVYVDIVLLNPKGGVSRIVEKNITEDRFIEWLERIRSAKGIAFDEDV